MSQQARDLSWLINNFNEKVAGVSHAVVVSSDGLLLVASAHLPRENAEHLAALVTGLSSIAHGAASLFKEAGVLQSVVQMPNGSLLVRSISDGSILATLVHAAADIGTVGYEMTKLAKQAGELLTPELRQELRPQVNNSAGAAPPPPPGHPPRATTAG